MLRLPPGPAPQHGPVELPGIAERVSRLQRSQFGGLIGAVEARVGGQQVVEALTGIAGREGIPARGRVDDLVDQYHPRLSRPEKLFMMEFALHGLAEHSLIGKKALDTGQQFKDLLGSMFNPGTRFGEEEDEDQF